MENNNNKDIYGSVDLNTLKEIKVNSMTPSSYNGIDLALLRNEEMIIKTNDVTLEMRIPIESILTYFKKEIGAGRQDKESLMRFLTEKRTKWEELKAYLTIIKTGGKRKLKSIKIKKELKNKSIKKFKNKKLKN